MCSLSYMLIVVSNILMGALSAPMVAPSALICTLASATSSQWSYTVAIGATTKRIKEASGRRMPWIVQRAKGLVDGAATTLGE